jgi:hypothetical protein
MAKAQKTQQAAMIEEKPKIKVGDAAGAFFTSNSGSALTGALVGVSTLGMTALLFFH